MKKTMESIWNYPRPPALQKRSMEVVVQLFGKVGQNDDDFSFSRRLTQLWSRRLSGRANASPFAKRRTLPPGTFRRRPFRPVCSSECRTRARFANGR